MGGLLTPQPKAKAIDAINYDRVDFLCFRFFQHGLVLPYDGDAMATNRAAEEALSELLSSD
jgi:hypothetical protein